MGSRVAFVIAILIVLSGLGQPTVHSGGSGINTIRAAPEPISGTVIIDEDWVVDSLSEYRNATIYLTGNLTVTGTGILSLENTSLVMNISENGQYGIEIEGYFTMADIDANPVTIADRSQIISNNTMFRYLMYALQTAHIDLSNSLVRDCGYSSAANGLNILTNNAVMAGMTFQDNYDGVFIRADGAEIRNSTFLNNQRGISVYFSEPTMENLTIYGSQSSGLYLYYSSPDVVNCTIDNNPLGIYVRNAMPNIINCQVMNSSDTGIYNYYSSPLVKDCILSNARDLEAVTNSFPRFLNTTFNESSAVLGFGLYAHVGDYVDVLVKNQTGVPMANMTVAVLDGDGNPASRGFTDGSGLARKLAYREKLLTSDGPLNMSQHRLMAFRQDGTNITFGENLTAIAGGTVDITTRENPPDVTMWEPGHIVSGTVNFTNVSIIALGDITITGGALSLDNSSLMVFSTGSTARNLLCDSGSLTVSNSTIQSIGVSRSLRPGYVYISSNAGFVLSIVYSGFRWTSEFEIRTDLAVLRNINMDFPSASGLDIVSSGPRVENIVIDWTARGLSLSSDTSSIINANILHARDYGIYSSYSDAVLENVSVAGSSTGLYAYNSALDISNMNIGGCDYGVYGLYSDMVISESILNNSSYYGAYLTGGQILMGDCSFGGGGTGIHAQETQELWAENITVSGFNKGLEVKSCAPVILNSTLANSVDVAVDRGSSAALVNCSLDQANVSVEPSGFIDIGNWMNVLVVNQSLVPVSGCHVSVLDSLGQVSGSGITDPNGDSGPISYRQRRILWNHTENHTLHQILAFRTLNGTLQGTNTSALWPGATVQVQVASNGMGWLEWTDYRNINACELYVDKTIIAHDSAVVDNDGCLRLQNSNLWFFGGSKLNLQLDIKWGTFEMDRSQLKPIAVSAPLQPFRFWVTYRATGDGFIVDSEISGLQQFTCYASNVQFQNSSISDSAYTGLHIEKCSPTVDNMTFIHCHDGLWVDTGYPAISNSSFIECADNGFYSLGGAPELRNCQASRNYYGFATAIDSDAKIYHCTASSNMYGFHVKSASPSITGSMAADNEDSGFYMSDSHASIMNCQAQGNNYGIYTYYSWPDIQASNMTDNDYGIYSYHSGPYVSGCNMDGNTVGFYEMGSASGFSTAEFSSGSNAENAVFVNGGLDNHVSIDLPARAVVTEANISVRGSEIGDDAIIEDDEFQFAPQIYGDWVVWQDSRDGNWEIYACNLSVDSDMDGIPNYLENLQPEDDPAIVRITNNTDAQTNPDIYQDTIVWTDQRNKGYDIYAYTFSNDTEWPVCVDSSVQRRPAIYGDHVVWEDYRNGNYDIYMLNITKGEVSRLSTSSRHDMGARIHENYVVWYSYAGSPGTTEYSDIVLFDINKWSTIYITDDNPLQYEPDVYRNNIVWHDNRNGNWEIYRYDMNTHTETRLTHEPEQSFCPRIFKGNIVYYYHDRIQDTWSVRMYDLTTGNQTVLEEETNGDSHPVIYDHRAAWVNKSGNRYDIQVLDFNMGGLPYDIAVDMGMDGTVEFHWPGELNSTEYINGSIPINTLNRFVNRAVNGTATIPISIRANGTGRIVLEIVSLAYDIPTYVLNTTISNSVQNGVKCSGSAPMFINSSLQGNVNDFSLMYGSQPVVLNSSFNSMKLSFSDRYSNLTVKNFLHIDVQNLTGAPVNASVIITDNGMPMANTSTGSDGQLEWNIVTEARYNVTGFNDNITIVNVSRGSSIFNLNPRYVNMSASHWEYFVTDTVPPVVEQVFPPPYWSSSQLRPEISTIITDNAAINISSARLYVNDFAVFYTSSPVPGGYNLSYQHPVDFSDGQVIRCRVYAEDIYGNSVDFSWEFKIDANASAMSIELIAGWNLISTPFDAYNQTIAGTLGAINGKYDMVMAYSPLHPDGPWLSYSPDRPDVYNDDFTITRKMGFWVRTTEACTLLVSGIPKNSTSIPLYAGWNLVGYTVLGENRTVSNALWGTGADRVEGFDPAAPYLIKELPSDYIMKPGEGYWIHVTADTVWTVDWNN